MKVIDLLNKIANGEKVPKKFKFANEIFTNNGIYISDEDGDSIFASLFSDFSNLNDEVEIIEEDKNIKKLQLGSPEDNPSNMYIINEYGTKCFLTKHSKIMALKINELIDEVNRLKRGK